MESTSSYLDDMAIKLLVSGLGIVCVLFCVLGVSIYIWQHRKRRYIYRNSNKIHSTSIIQTKDDVEKKSEGLSKSSKIKQPGGQNFPKHDIIPLKPCKEKQNQSSLNNIINTAKDNEIVVIKDGNVEGCVSIIEVFCEHQGIKFLKTNQESHQKYFNEVILDERRQPINPNRGNPILNMWYSGIDSTNVKNSEQNDTHITAYMNGTESFVATNQKRIRAEFDELENESGSVICPRTNAAEFIENIRKNRFFDVLPFDENRVKIKVREKPTLDNFAQIMDKKEGFINASYITFPFNELKSDTTNKMIAAQDPIGPEEAHNGHRLNTIADFWQMVWQESVDTIVCMNEEFITKAEIGNNEKNKCTMYWPESPSERVNINDDLTIFLYCSTENELLYMREIWLESTNEHISMKRKVIQWHFKPKAKYEEAECLLRFVETVRASTKRKPILVHCSNGSDRTGVFISLFALLELLENKEPIDVFSVVRSLKSQRQKFVPRFDFYMLIYKSISLAIQRQFQTTNLRAKGW